MINNRLSMQCLSILLAGFSLTACGGGGGSDGGSSTSSPAKQSSSAETPPSATPTAGTAPSDADAIETEPNKEVVDTDISSTYVSMSSVERNNHPSAGLAGANVISMARTSCGLGGLNYDDDLAQSALAHANYIKHVYINSQPTAFNAHSEATVAGIESYTGEKNPFFTGINLRARLVEAAYPNLRYGATENIVQTSSYNPDGTIASPDYAASMMATSLLAAPYHLKSLMGASYGQTGSAMVAYTPYNSSPKNNMGYVFVNLSAGNAESIRQEITDIFTYPCDGVTNTSTALYNESPDPVAGTGRDLSTDPIGQPIFINMPTAETIKVSNVRFYDASRKIDVPTNLLDAQSDPHANTSHAMKPNEAFILPITDNLKSCQGTRGAATNCGLHGNTTYQVSFDVLVDNRTLKQQSFKFTTGKVG